MESWEYEKIKAILELNGKIEDLKVSTLSFSKFIDKLKSNGFDEHNHHFGRYREVHSLRKGDIHVMLEKTNKYHKLSIHKDIFDNEKHRAVNLDGKEIEFILNLLK